MITFKLGQFLLKYPYISWDLMPYLLFPKVVDSLSFSKMNVFHWHITDTQSFPLHLPSLPEFSRYGAYSLDKVYTPEQVRDLVTYARDRGVRVIPELDAPAHVGKIQSEHIVSYHKLCGYSVSIGSEL